MICRSRECNYFDIRRLFFWNVRLCQSRLFQTFDFANMNMQQISRSKEQFATFADRFYVNKVDKRFTFVVINFLFFVIYFIIFFVQIREVKWKVLLILIILQYVLLFILVFVICFLLIWRIDEILLKFIVDWMLRFANICKSWEFRRIFYISERLSIFFWLIWLIWLHDRLIRDSLNSGFVILLPVTIVRIEIWNKAWTKVVLSIFFERFRNIVRLFFELILICSLLRILILIRSIVEIFKSEYSSTCKLSSNVLEFVQSI